MAGKIDSFEGENYFLSNFYVVPVEWEGEIFPSTEHLYQALKTTNPEERTQIRLQPTPGESKKLGKKVTLRSDWDEVKDDFMQQILLSKFTQHPDLQEKLIATGNDELIEGNWWGDDYWGVCNGKGQNKLGKFLMELRDNLKGTARAPFSSEQVASLEEYQECGTYHPFTCGDCGNSLKPTAAGWVCPTQGCSYTQDWCHSFMFMGKRT